MKATKLELQNTNFFFCLFSVVIYSPLRPSNGDEAIRSHDLEESFTEVKPIWMTMWDGCRHYSSGVKTQLHTHMPFPQSRSPQPVLCHLKYPVSFLWSIFQKKYNIRCLFLAPAVAGRVPVWHVIDPRGHCHWKAPRERTTTHSGRTLANTGNEEHMKMKHPKMKGVPLPHQTFLHEERPW